MSGGAGFLPSTVCPAKYWGFCKQLGCLVWPEVSKNAVLLSLFSDRWRYWFLSSRWWRRSTNGQSWIISLRWTFETHHLECQQRLNQKQQWRSKWGDFSPNISRGYFIYFTPCISSYWPHLVKNVSQVETHLNQQNVTPGSTTELLQKISFARNHGKHDPPKKMRFSNLGGSWKWVSLKLKSWGLIAITNPCKLVQSSWNEGYMGL